MTGTGATGATTVGTAAETAAETAAGAMLTDVMIGATTGTVATGVMTETDVTIDAIDAMIVVVRMTHLEKDGMNLFLLKSYLLITTWIAGKLA